ncbi:BTAD domain-containing putative transcriptional regulator [Actinomadura opuntiae]|uniref:BTAD domain-containing putative transcriptional regulator n=1 Tax=Actinomadura sp. OS1-43 TaxID=604315 RepID=UPI00255B36F3|nr:BTAD domain-containing putative transcriptional regulator [Actinomadura sp. OS1-43]MDL4814219.1 BTAD domain-containing putative transcriptional regulator [Actinomadura sp. OS1-43]
MAADPLSVQAPRFEILGRLRAWRGEEELDLGPGKQRAVLAVLLLEPNRSVSTKAIVDAVWGEEPPDNGANVVQKYVAGLRRVLEPDRSPRAPSRLLVLTSAGYSLHVAPGALDAEVFRNDVREAKAVRAQGQIEKAGALLCEALGLWHGQALHDIQGRFFEAARERLADERAAAAEAAAEIDLDLGRHAELVPELNRLVTDFPLREGLRFLLMLALYRSGRQAEALAAYRDARTFLTEEFGVEPGERLQHLHLSILRGDLPPGPVPRDRAPEVVPHAFAPPDAKELPASDMNVIPVAAAAAPIQTQDSADVELAGLAGLSGPATAAQWADDAIPAAPPQLGWAVPAPDGGAVAVHRPARRHPWPLRLVASAVPVVTFGICTWALIAYFAGRRRSAPLGAAAAGYLLLITVFLAIVTSEDADAVSALDGVAMGAWLVTMFGGAVHVAVLTADAAGPGRPAAAPQPPAPAMVDYIERRTCREQARSLLRHHPAMARELGIGRPDLPRDFDDGGLVDVNTVPEHVLESLPGVDPYHAKLIVTARQSRRFASPEDLIVQGLLPAPVVRALNEVLVAMPVAEPNP